MDHALATDDLPLVLMTPLEAFVASQKWFFLVGEPRIQRSARPTVRDVPKALRSVDTLAQAEATLSMSVSRENALPHRFVAALRKRTQHASEQITVGRTSTNDVVVPDVTVSRVHAWFRIEGAAVQLVDAGSRNGTRLRGAPISANKPVFVQPGDRVRFGSVELAVLDARTTWEIVRAGRSI